MSCGRSTAKENRLGTRGNEWRGYIRWASNNSLRGSTDPPRHVSNQGGRPLNAFGGDDDDDKEIWTASPALECLPRSKCRPDRPHEPLGSDASSLVTSTPTRLVSCPSFHLEQQRHGRGCTDLPTPRPEPALCAILDPGEPRLRATAAIVVAHGVHRSTPPVIHHRRDRRRPRLGPYESPASRAASAPSSRLEHAVSVIHHFQRR